MFILVPLAFTMQNSSIYIVDSCAIIRIIKFPPR